MPVQLMPDSRKLAAVARDGVIPIRTNKCAAVMWHCFREAKAMGVYCPIHEQPAFSNPRIFLGGLV